MTTRTPLHSPAAPTASLLSCPSFPGSYAGTNSLRSNFASLPQGLLQKIFARVHHEGKPICETVCRAWRAALSCMPKGTWGPLTVVITRDRELAQMRLQSGLVRASRQAATYGTEVALIEADLPHQEPGASFVQWLCRRAVGISCVILEIYTGTTGWLLPRLLLSLSNGGWQSPERPPLQLETGDLSLLSFSHGCRQLANVVQSWSVLKCLQRSGMQDPPDGIGNLTMLVCLTRLDLCDAPHLGNLTELRLMPNLRNLTLLDAEQSSQREASFVNLQTLDLRQHLASSWDLSCCTRLTQLSLTILPDFQRLSLPHGDDVQLQVLKAWKEGLRDNEDFVLQHLAVASKLTHLEFTRTYPSTLRDGPWPSYLPHLHDVSLHDLHAALPIQWLSYPQLTYLDLFGLQQAHLPNWFSNMTQLSSLCLSCSSITVFPECLLSLSQLQSLDLCHTHIMVIPSEVVRIAHWPNLKMINLAKPGGYDLDSHMHLLDLYSRLTSGHCDILI